MSAPLSSGPFAQTAPEVIHTRLRGQRHLRRWAQRTLSTGAAVATRIAGPRTPSVVGILMLHRVVTPPRGAPAPTWNVLPQQFRRQLTGLLARGYQPLRLIDLVAAHHAGNWPLGRYFVVTFDDACSNVCRYALPILAELRVPATVFLATAYLDSRRPFPFDDWQATAMGVVPEETWLPLSTDECHQMVASGWVDLGSHTHTHADFRGQPELFRADLLHSLAVLHDRFGLSRHEIPFAFPFGTASLGFAGGELSRVAEQVGVTCALSTEQLPLSPSQDPFHWGRFTVWDFDSADSLAGKLSGWYSTLRHVFRRADHLAPAASTSA